MNPQTEVRRSAAGPGGGPACRRSWPKTASGGLGKFGHSKAYVDPRHASVSGVKSAEGVTHSVMDTLSYGLSSPQLALMNNGEVFVAGQVQMPMTPPVTKPPATQSDLFGNREEGAGRIVVEDAASVLTTLMVGSDLLGLVPTCHLMLTDAGATIIGGDGQSAWAPLGVTAQQFALYGSIFNNPTPEDPTPDITAAIASLALFRRGGAWDLQRLNGGTFEVKFRDSATIVIGIFAASAGIPYPVLMGIQNTYAMTSTWKAGTAMDVVYTHLPALNVLNTQIGYNLILNGQITPYGLPQ